MQLGRDRALAEDVDGARGHAAVGREALDERDAATGRDPRRLELPLRRVNPLHLARVEIDQPDPGLVPGALGGIVGADRRDLAAGPAELEDVHPNRGQVLHFATPCVDEPEPPPELRGAEDLRVVRLGSGLLDLRRRLRAGLVGAEVGREDEQARTIGRPRDVFDRARDLAQLRVVDPEGAPSVVPVVGRVREPRPVGREARDRPELARPELAVDVPEPEPDLHRLALLAERSRDGGRDALPVGGERDLAGPQ